MVFGISCSALQGVTDESADPTGYGAIIYLNRSAALVQTVAALAYSGEPPIVWVNAVAPDTWKSLVFECEFTQIALVSAIPVDLTTGKEGETVPFDGDPLREGREIMCVRSSS